MLNLKLSTNKMTNYYKETRKCFSKKENVWIHKCGENAYVIRKGYSNEKELEIISSLFCQKCKIGIKGLAFKDKGIKNWKWD